MKTPSASINAKPIQTKPTDSSAREAEVQKMLTGWEETLWLVYVLNPVTITSGCSKFCLQGQFLISLPTMECILRLAMKYFEYSPYSIKTEQNAHRSFTGYATFSM